MVRFTLVAEPRAIAPLPLVTTNHTKLSTAATSHVVAALLQFNHGFALVASFPTFLVGLFEKLGCLLVARALSWIVPLGVTSDANLGLATAALGYLSTGNPVTMNVGWLNPLAASFVCTIHTVPS